MVILVPTDFSKNGDSAVKYAIGFAEKVKSKLVFLHAFRLVQKVSSSEKAPLKIKEEWNIFASKKFQQLKSDLLKDVSINYEFVAEIGFADDCIRNSVKTYNAKIIIMGSSGDGAWAGVFGSTTQNIINDSKCPVVIVPPEAKYSSPRHIAFAFDFKHIENTKQLRSAVQFLSGEAGHLDIINIDKKNANVKKQWIESIFHPFEIEYHITQGDDVVTGIVNFVENNDLDILVMLKRNHTLMEQVFSTGITNKIVHNSNLPIMVVHE